MTLPDGWERFTGFLPSAGTVWRRPLPGDRRNAWVTQHDVETFQWSIEDNTCGHKLASGYTETLDEALAEADAAIQGGTQ